MRQFEFLPQCVVASLTQYPVSDTISFTLMGGVVMLRWMHRPPYRISYRNDCNFALKAETLGEALRIGSVGILVDEAEGKTLEEISELFDKEGDEYIARRVRSDHWHHKT